MLVTANTGEFCRGFGKNAGEWTGRVEKKRKIIMYVEKKQREGAHAATVVKLSIPSLQHAIRDLDRMTQGTLGS